MDLQVSLIWEEFNAKNFNVNCRQRIIYLYTANAVMSEILSVRIWIFCVSLCVLTRVAQNTTKNGILVSLATCDNFETNPW